MIKALIQKRIEVLLSRIEKIAEEIADHQVDKENSLSVIQQSRSGLIPPHLMKKFRAVQNEIIMLKTLGVV